MFTDFLDECRAVKTSNEPYVGEVKETHAAEPLSARAA